MVVLVILALLLLIYLSGKGGAKAPRSINEATSGTMLAYRTDGTIEMSEYSGIDEYYSQEEAANYLCSQEKYNRVEIKDDAGKVYRYDQAALKRLGWL